MATGLVSCFAAIASGGAAAPVAVSAVAGCVLYLGIESMLFRASSVRVSRRGDHVFGLGDAPLPVGQGAIVVDGRHVHRRGRAAPTWRVVWRDDAEQRVLFDHCSNAGAVRSFARELAELGLWEMHWTQEGDRAPERRTADGLRMPLGERLRRLPALLPRATPIAGGVTITELPEHGLSARFPRPRRRMRSLSMVPALASTIPGVVGLAVGQQAFGGGLGLLSLGLGVGATLARVAWVAGVDVTSDSLTLHWRHLPAGRETPTTLSADAVQALHLEVEPLPRLVLVANEAHIAIGEGADLGQLRWARAAILSALAGHDVVAGARDGSDVEELAGPSPLPLAAASEVWCPRCDHQTLARIGGPLDEHACDSCGGRFASPAGAARLFEEMGLDPEMLRDLANMFAGDRLPCPSCRSPMSAVQLKGVGVDLCTGCGGLWFDRGELGRMTQGRYAG